MTLASTIHGVIAVAPGCPSGSRTSALTLERSTSFVRFVPFVRTPIQLELVSPVAVPAPSVKYAFPNWSVPPISSGLS